MPTHRSGIDQRLAPVPRRSEQALQERPGHDRGRYGHDDQHREHVLWNEAQPAAYHMPMNENLFHDAARQIDRNRESDALGTTVLAIEYGGVDAYLFQADQSGWDLCV